MSGSGVDPRTLEAWLSGRSIARGLPAPVADHGGFRVDTNSDIERRRWVFPAMSAELGELARSIHEPRDFIKLCGEADELRSALPHGWVIDAPSYFMRAHGGLAERRLPAGYTIETERIGAAVAVRILSHGGDLAASGHAGETPDAFVYDRIVTAPGHRRKGLGHAMMAALHAARTHHDPPELLVATEDGRALYSILGWRTISTYSSASVRA